MGQRNNTQIPINKNCDIIMCRDKYNRQDENVLERKVLSDLCNIFTKHPHLKDNGVRIGIQSSNAFAYILNGFHENRIVIKIPKNGKVDSLKYEYFIGCDIRNTRSSWRGRSRSRSSCRGYSYSSCGYRGWSCNC